MALLEHTVLGGNLGRCLYRQRMALRRTSTEVARAAGISQPYLSEIERGRMASPVILRKLARVLDIEDAVMYRAYLLDCELDARRQWEMDSY